jgi:hypothetical protein
VLQTVAFIFDHAVPKAKQPPQPLITTPLRSGYTAALAAASAGGGGDGSVGSGGGGSGGGGGGLEGNVRPLLPREEVAVKLLEEMDAWLNGRERG